MGFVKRYQLIIVIIGMLASSCQPKKEKATGWEWLPANMDSTVVFAPHVISDTARIEMASSFSRNGDTVYFSIRSKRVAGRNFWTLMSSSFIDGTWSQPDTLSFSNKFSDYGAYLSPDGGSLYFSSRRPVHSSDSSMKGEYDLWVSKRRGEQWAEPERLADGINTNLEEYSVAVSHSNLFICSTRNDSVGMTDLFIAPRQEEKNIFNSRKNLGANVNTKYYEGNCYVDPEETTLVFNFFGEGENSNEDIFASFKKNGSWSTPLKLNELVNTPANEFAYWLSPDKKVIFFGRNGDILMAPFDKALPITKQ
jgi:hypothetical protein